MSGTRKINPDSLMLQQIDGQWEKLAMLMLWKMKGKEALIVTHEDIKRLMTEFGEAGPVVYIHGHVDSIQFQLVDHKRAHELAELDRQRHGHA